MLQMRTVLMKEATLGESKLD